MLMGIRIHQGSVILLELQLTDMIMCMLLILTIIESGK